MANQIIIDRLDKKLLDRIKESDCVLLADINKEFAQVPYHKLWYRIITLADQGYIKISRSRNSVKCFYVGDIA